MELFPLLSKHRQQKIPIKIHPTTDCTRHAAIRLTQTVTSKKKALHPFLLALVGSASLHKLEHLQSVDFVDGRIRQTAHNPKNKILKIFWGIFFLNLFL